MERIYDPYSTFSSQNEKSLFPEERKNPVGFVQEFKAFAMRGNVIDLAVGVIIGGAFGKITSSLVNDIIMPPVGLAVGNMKFDDFFITLSTPKDPAAPLNTLAEAKAAGVATLNYGVFLTTVLDFTILAFAIFLMVKFINRLKDLEEKRLKAEAIAAPAPAPVVPATKECPRCYSTIPIKATRCPHCTSEL